MNIYFPSYILKTFLKINNQVLYNYFVFINKIHFIYNTDHNTKMILFAIRAKNVYVLLIWFK